MKPKEIIINLYKIKDGRNLNKKERKKLKKKRQKERKKLEKQKLERENCKILFVKEENLENEKVISNEITKLNNKSEDEFKKLNNEINKTVSKEIDLFIEKRFKVEIDYRQTYYKKEIKRFLKEEKRKKKKNLKEELKLKNKFIKKNFQKSIEKMNNLIQIEKDTVQLYYEDENFLKIQNKSIRNINNNENEKNILLQKLGNFLTKKLNDLDYEKNIDYLLGFCSEDFKIYKEARKIYDEKMEILLKNEKKILNIFNMKKYFEFDNLEFFLQKSSIINHIKYNNYVEERKRFENEKKMKNKGILELEGIEFELEMFNIFRETENENTTNFLKYFNQEIDEIIYEFFDLIKTQIENFEIDQDIKYLINDDKLLFNELKIILLENFTVIQKRTKINYKKGLFSEKTEKLFKEHKLHLKRKKLFQETPSETKKRFIKERNKILENLNNQKNTKKSKYKKKINKKNFNENNKLFEIKNQNLEENKLREIEKGKYEKNIDIEEQKKKILLEGLCIKEGNIYEKMEEQKFYKGKIKKNENEIIED